MKAVKIAGSLICATLMSLMAPGSLAQENYLDVITSADICAPVNVGKAIRTIQNLRGNILNNSTDETIAVSCPVAIETGAAEILLRVNAQNSSDVTADFRCAAPNRNTAIAMSGNAASYPQFGGR